MRIPLLAFTLAFAVVPVASAATFTDVPDTHPFAPYVELLVRWEVISSASPTFGVQRPVTRAEFAKMVVRARKLNELPRAHFCDVPLTHWANGYIGALVARGVIAGGQGTCGLSFHPERPITRAETLKIVLGTFQVEGQTGSATFSDVPRDAWYQSLLQTAVAKKIIRGTADGRFLPDAPVTRGEVAKILVRVLDPSELYVPPR